MIVPENLPKKAGAWSVNKALGAPYMQMKFFKKASAMVRESVRFKGTPIEYFVNKS